VDERREKERKKERLIAELCGLEESERWLWKWVGSERSK